MDLRRAALCLALLLIAATAQAQEDPRQKTSAKLEVLQNQLSDPEDFKSYVEGSRRSPAAAFAPKTQIWPQSSGAAAIGAPAKPAPIARIPLIPAGYRGRARIPLPASYAYRPRSTLPGKQELPKWPLASLGLTALAVAGLFAFVNNKGFRSGPVPEPIPAELPPAQPITQTPAARELLSKIEAPIERPEPYIDTRMPVASWRAISWREQHLLEMWDVSFEKSVGQPFADWLDSQGPLEGVDAALLKAKLDRPI